MGNDKRELAAEKTPVSSVDYFFEDVDCLALLYNASHWVRRKFPSLSPADSEVVTGEALHEASLGYQRQRGGKPTTFFYAILKRKALRLLKQRGYRRCPQCKRRGAVRERCPSPFCRGGWIVGVSAAGGVDVELLPAGTVRRPEGETHEEGEAELEPQVAPSVPFGGKRWEWLREHRPMVYAVLCAIRDWLPTEDGFMWWALVYCETDSEEKMRAADVGKLFGMTGDYVRVRVHRTIRPKVAELIRKLLDIAVVNHRETWSIREILRDCRDNLVLEQPEMPKPTGRKPQRRSKPKCEKGT